MSEQHLLPPNASAPERALSLAIDRPVPTPVRDVWSADTCPSALLPWLAWALSVDDWDSSWTDTQKRQVIKASTNVHRYKGTIGAVRESVAALGVQAVVQEWFNQIPQAEPYTFRVHLQAEQTGISQTAITRFHSVIERSKNLRSHLTETRVVVTSQAGPQVAVVATMGSDITLTGFEWATAVINENFIAI